MNLARFHRPEGVRSRRSKMLNMQHRVRLSPRVTTPPREGLFFAIGKPSPSFHGKTFEIVVDFIRANHNIKMQSHYGIKKLNRPMYMKSRGKNYDRATGSALNRTDQTNKRVHEYSI
jgi:hypothetical protein